MPFRWNKHLQLEPWRHLELEVRTMPRPRDDVTDRLRGSIREIIRAEGGRRITKSTISFDPNMLPTLVEALKEGIELLPTGVLEQEAQEDPTTENLEALLEYVSDNGRVCPLPNHWHQIWEMLPERRRAGGGWEPPVPLILGGWWESSDDEKRERLALHIRWALERGVFRDVNRSLRELTEDEWHHEGDAF